MQPPFAFFLVAVIVLIFPIVASIDLDASQGSVTKEETLATRSVPDDCGDATECATCVTNSSCGWCVSLHKCIPGNETGPANGGCLVWDYQTCPEDHCEQFETCEACAISTGCGWCTSKSSQSACIAGSASGPFNEKAVCPIWDWGVPSCSSSIPCANHTTCDACTNDTNCGWCSDGNTPRCASGNITTPYEGQCQKWSYGQTCQDQFCFKFTDCTSCTKSSLCGWCNETSVCMPGDTNAPKSGVCPAGEEPEKPSWFFGKCPITPILGCAARRNCSSCVDDPNCGWCVDNGVCYRQDSAPENCTFFRTGSCRDPCRDKKTCYQCSSEFDCGWCNNTVCVSGTDGPVQGSCNEWEKTPTSCNNTNCTDFMNCDACTQPSNKNCAWCDSLQPARCLYIANPPPEPGDPTCPVNWYYGHCPAPVDCRDHSTCEECTSLHCWWCGDTNKCKDYKLFQNCFQTPGLCHPIPPHNSGDEGLSGGEIAGIVIGSIGGAVLVGVLAGLAWYRFYWLRKHYYEVLR